MNDTDTSKHVSIRDMKNKNGNMIPYTERIMINSDIPNTINDTINMKIFHMK